MKALLTSLVVSALASTSAHATTIFFDDFEDETSPMSPSIDTSSSASNQADVGGSWSGGGITQINGADGQYIITSNSNPSTASFDSIQLEGSSFSLLYFLDHTPAGRTDATITFLSGGTELIKLTLIRGNQNQNRRIQMTDGTGLNLLNIDNTDSWEQLNLSFEADSYSLTNTDVANDGTIGAADGTLTGLGYATDSLNGIDQIIFQNGTSNNSREFLIDNVRLENSAPVPEPGLAGLSLIGLLSLTRRKRS